MDNLMKMFSDIENNASKLDDVTKIPLDDLFTDNFISKHTNFKTFDEMLSAAYAEQALKSLGL